MNIIIEKDAENFIKKHCKDNTITLFIKPPSGGWCSVENPTVQLGKPQEADNFHMYCVDEINVFVSQNAEIKNNKLHVFLRKFLWIKELAVDGIQISFKA